MKSTKETNDDGAGPSLADREGAAPPLRPYLRCRGGRQSGQGIYEADLDKIRQTCAKYGRFDSDMADLKRIWQI